MKKDWEEIEKFFKLLERDETLDKQLKETTGSEEYFLIILESLSPLHTLETRKEKERKEELKKLYDLCSFDEELDKELGTMAGINGGYLTRSSNKDQGGSSSRPAIKAATIRPREIVKVRSPCKC